MRIRTITSITTNFLAKSSPPDQPFTYRHSSIPSLSPHFKKNRTGLRARPASRNCRRLVSAPAARCPSSRPRADWRRDRDEMLSKIGAFIRRDGAHSSTRLPRPSEWRRRACEHAAARNVARAGGRAPSTMRHRPSRRASRPIEAVQDDSFIHPRRRPRAFHDARRPTRRRA